MTRDEFERQFAEDNKVTVIELRSRGLVPQSCGCGYDGCPGWRMATYPFWWKDSCVCCGREFHKKEMAL